MFSPEYIKEKKSLDKARAMLKKCMDANDDEKFEMYSDLANFLADKKSLFLQFKRDFAAIYMNCGIYFENSGYDEEALAAYANASQLDNDIKYLKKYAELSEKLKYWEDSLEANIKIIKMEPDDGDAWASAAYAFLGKGDKEQALKYVEKSIEVDKHCLKAYDVLIEIKGRKPDILLNKAYALYRHGFYDDAIKCAKEAIESSKGKNDFKVELGRIYILCGRYEDALDIAEKVLLEEKEREDAIALKAESYVKIGDLKSATDCVDFLISKNPSNKDALKVLANLLYMKKKYKDVIKISDKFEKLHGIDIEMQTIAAEAARDLGDKKSEMIAYEKIICEDVENAQGYFGKGRALMEMGKYEDAEMYIKKSCELDEKKEYKINYAELLRKMERFDEAMKILDEISSDNDKTLVACRILLDTGKYGECIEMCNRSGFPDDEFYYLKGISAMHLRRFEEAKESLEKIRNKWDVENLIKKCEDMKRKIGMEKYVRNIVEFEKENGRLPTKEEAFRDCHVPFEKLDDALKYMEEDEEIDLKSLTPMERKIYSETAMKVVASYGDSDVPIWHILEVLGTYTVYDAKLLKAYISKVITEKISMKVTPELEEMGRKALHLDPNERNIAGIVRRLNVSIEDAKRVLEFINLLSSESDAVKSTSEREATISLETPDMEMDVHVPPIKEKKKKKGVKRKKKKDINLIERDMKIPSDEKLDGAVEEISDIIDRIEKKEIKKVSSEKEMCDICGKVIATISHECGGDFCSRCVIEYNRGSSGAKKCPRCNKPLIKKRKSRWRDAL